GVGEHADELVAEDRARLEAGRPAVVGEQVRAADRGVRDAHDRVAVLAQLRIRDVGNLDLLRAGQPHRPHAGCSSSTRLPSGSTAKQRWPPHGGEYGSARNGTPAAESSACAPRQSATSTTRIAASRDGSAGAVIVTPGRSSAAWPCSASDSRVPAA